jgi:hypothetical protein
MDETNFDKIYMLSMMSPFQSIVIIKVPSISQITW